MQTTDLFSSFIMHVLLSMQTQDMTTNHTSPFFSHHSYTNHFAVIKTHYKDGCTLSLNKTDGGRGYFANKSVQRVPSAEI